MISLPLSLMVIAFSLLYFSSCPPSSFCFVSPSPSPSSSLPFHWGVATASYQIEGSWHADGKQLSDWDVFANSKLNDTGNVADAGYTRWREDNERLEEMGVSAYRFSISWGRIIDERGQLNTQGVAHYSHIIDDLLERGITPYVTMFHWDLPFIHSGYIHQEEGENGGEAEGEGEREGGDTQSTGNTHGWLNYAYMRPVFLQYAAALFESFGDRVRHWIIFNESETFCLKGYASGTFPPNRCSDRNKCRAGNSTTEPLICAHTVLLLSRDVIQLYRTNYSHQCPATAEAEGKCQIGLALSTAMSVPYNGSSPADVSAAERALEWQIAHWADPLFFGDYPDTMKRRLGSLLPPFTPEQKALFLAYPPSAFFFNHYTSSYVYYLPHTEGGGVKELNTTQTSINGTTMPQAASDWLFIYPEGLYGVTMWISERYNQQREQRTKRAIRELEANTDIYSAIVSSLQSDMDSIFSPLLSPSVPLTVPLYVTENGVDVPGEGTAPLPSVLHDEYRIHYLSNYTDQLLRAQRAGADVRGYFCWSFMDNFEWLDGYTLRFGLIYVDYKNNTQRYWKDSALWYKQMIATDRQKRGNTEGRLSAQPFTERM